jgi:hypothetical protein
MFELLYIFYYAVISLFILHVILKIELKPVVFFVFIFSLLNLYIIDKL